MAIDIHLSHHYLVNMDVLLQYTYGKNFTLQPFSHIFFIKIK